MSTAVEFIRINKYFPGAHVLKDISFSINEGEVHALIGENGAGKSTLLNILHGIYPDYEGNVKLFGEEVHFRNPYEAINNGKISKVHQETNVVKEMTVGENITLGCAPSNGIFIDRKRINKEVDRILETLNCKFSSSTMASKLSSGEMQMMSIARALYQNAKIISLDEPTASLSIKETEDLFERVQDLKSKGITFIYVSHRLNELFHICDRATILRDGECITTVNVNETTQEKLIRYMVGRDVSSLATRTMPDMTKEEILLKAEDFTGEKFRKINFVLHRGEILGFSGLVGAGRTELMRAIIGADRKRKGTLYLKGKRIEIKKTSDALKNGIGMLPEDRKTQGFLNLSTNKDNICISSMEKYMTGWFVNEGKKKKNSQFFVEKLKINPPKIENLTSTMSGGNQQKVIIARWLSTNIDVIIFDEPTKGVDVGAKVEIYRLIEDLAAEGKGVIVVSSELPEVMGISDRIIVMHEGDKVAELKPEEYNEEVIMQYSIGGK